MGWKANEVSDGSGAVERADVLGVNPLTDNNTTPSITDATFGEVANFQRANSEYFDIADPFYSASFVMCFWFRSTDLLNSYNLVGKDHSGAAGREYLIDQASTSGLLTFYVFSDNTTFRTAIIATSAAETWYFCVAWLDDSDKKARFQLNNGTPAVSTALPASLQDSGTALNFGRRSYPGFENYCNHRVHGLYVFSGTKDAAWRTAMYNAGAGRVYPD
jgi:hypothetical protein